MRTMTAMRNLVLVLAFLAVACGGPATPAGTGGASAPVAGPAGSAAPGSAVVDEALRDRLIASGEDVDDATFLAATTVEVFDPGPRSARVVEHLASGDNVTFIVTIQPGARGDPGILDLSVVPTADGREIVHLEYFVGSTGIPDDVLRSVEGTAFAGPLLAVSGSVPRSLTAEIDGWKVVVDWATAEISDTLRDEALEHFVEKYTPGKGGHVVSLVQAYFAGKDGLELGSELDALLKQLDELRKCAENPTNELTKELYKENPDEKERVLREIENARRDLIMNTIVMQLGVLNEFVAEFGPGWLPFAISGGTAWSKATLQDLNKARIDELTRGIPKCDEECKGGFTNGTGGSGGRPGGGSGGSGGSSAAPGPTCEFPFTLVGTVDYTVTHFGKKVFEGHATSVKWEWVPDRTTPDYTLYKLTGGTMTWSYSESMESPPCGPDTWTGGGSELLVPDEARDPGGEVGPGSPDEFAEMFINWTDPTGQTTPWYGGSASARLHDKITLAYGCGGPSREIDTNFFSLRLHNWIFFPYETPPVVKDGALQGTWAEVTGDLSKAYDWNFRPGP